MLIKSPELSHNCVLPLQYSVSARIAFQSVLENIDFSEGKKILLPAYIGITEREGSGVFDPIEKTNTQYEFYALDKSLSAYRKELYELIKSERFRALLIIHYFGFCQNDMETIVNLCQKYNVLLIEDCAHTMLSDIPLGQLGMLGDFSIYSIHKYLATNDGGCLRVNNKEYEHLLSLPSTPLPNSKTLDMLGRADLNAIRKKRRTNYLHLMNLLEGCLGIEIMYPELPSGISPHNFPVRIKDGRREQIYFDLIGKGIPVVALYYRLINQINGEKHGDELYVSENILNLPIHQDIDLDDLFFFKREFFKIL